MRNLKYEVAEEEMKNEIVSEFLQNRDLVNRKRKMATNFRSVIYELGACRDISYKTTYFFLTDNWLASPNHFSAQRGHQLHDTVVELEDYPLHSKDFRITSAFI